MADSTETAVSPRSLASLYIGASTTPVKTEQALILRRSIPEEDLDILPTGEIYASQVRYRRILNEAFGPAGWALVPVSEPITQDGSLLREWALFVNGFYVSQAIGEADHREDNQRMSWASAAEAARSSALTRCCKDLGIASECWDRHFCESFRTGYCVQVWVEGKDRPQWRRKDAPPFFRESRPVENSASGSTTPVASTTATTALPAAGAGKRASSSFAPPAPAPTTPPHTSAPSTHRVDVTALRALLAAFPGEVEPADARKWLVDMLECWPPEARDEVVRAASTYLDAQQKPRSIRSYASLGEVYSRGAYAGKPLVSDRWCHSSLDRLIVDANDIVAD